MITDEHFDVLRLLREEAATLRLACIASDQAGSLLHMAYDRGVSQRQSQAEASLLRRLRAVQ
jgi:hypothetical protein